MLAGRSAATRSSAERRVLGRLQHQRVAGGHRHRDLERAEHDRGVPRHDRADHADRLAARVAEDVLAERDGLALQLAGQAAEIAEDVGASLRLGPRLGAHRVAGLARDRAAPAPRPPPRPPRRCVASIRPRSRGATRLQAGNAADAAATARSTSAAPPRGIAREGLPIGRVLHRQRLAALGADPLAADQHPRLGQRRLAPLPRSIVSIAIPPSRGQRCASDADGDQVALRYRRARPASGHAQRSRPPRGPAGCRPASRPRRNARATPP